MELSAQNSVGLEQTHLLKLEGKNMEAAILGAIENFPNFMGLALLAAALFNMVNRLMERDEEHYKLLVALLTQCLGSRAQAEEIIAGVRGKKKNDDPQI